MRRSIRWTLLGWYAAILVLVIGGFGLALHVRQRQAALDRVHAELETHALAVTNAIEWDEPEGFEFEFRDDYRAYFEQRGLDAPYLVIWGPDHEVLVRTSAAPSDSETFARREIRTRGPEGTTILVGRGIVDLEQRAAEFGRTVLVLGAGALALALLGGWLLVRRVLRPIDRISQAARAITASNLEARIDVGRTESELGQLAHALNDAFDRLEAAVERQARFTADASHELRTPLAVIRASAEWGLRQDRSPEAHEETLETCLRAAKRMSRIVDGLLALARADAEAAPLQRSSVDLAVIAEQVATLLGPLAREGGVTLDVKAEPAPLEGDGSKLDALATVLLSNAILHHETGGHVDVRTATRDGSVWLEVRDDGPGISEIDLPHLFERFYRIDRARPGGTNGSGLGLAIAKQIVDAHDGEITVTSEEGAGTTFTVRLPARPAQGSPHSTQAAQ